jgi:hypothetical protein
MSLPSVADFILMFLDESFRYPDLPGCQAGIMGQFNLWLQPKLCFPAFTINMNVKPCFLAREEVEAEPSCSKNCWAQAMSSSAFRSLRE